DLVALGFEEVEEILADLVAGLGHGLAGSKSGATPGRCGQTHKITSPGRAAGPTLPRRTA
ncbi:MAG TPA: hypothetical protein VIM90_00170, partial [Arenimonas sp.]